MENILDQVNKIIANVEDDIEIAKMIEERDKRDSGKRHTTEEVRKRRKNGLYAKYWLIYEPKLIASRRIAKPFNSLEGMNNWIDKNKDIITVIAKTQTIESER